MLITFTQTRRLCSDGFTVVRYMEGETHEVPYSSAVHALHAGWAYNAEPPSGDGMDDVLNLLLAQRMERMRVEATGDALTDKMFAAARGVAV